MFRISATFRIALGLSSLFVSVVLLAAALGLVPDRRSAVLEGRAALVESLAVKCSLLARHDDIDAMRHGIRTIAKRNEGLLSVAVRRENGEILANSGPHVRFWNVEITEGSTETQMSVPISANGKPWGTVEACYAPIQAGSVATAYFGPLFSLVAFIAASGFLVNFVYLRKILQQLDPSRAVPARVREALDTLAEGLLVLDKDERIVLANESFLRTTGTSSQQLVGQKISHFPWSIQKGGEENQLLPWVDALNEGIRQTGRMIELETQKDDQRTFLVNCAPILGGDGKSRGVLASFDDVTVLEKKKAEMARMLELLQSSSDEIKRQNKELERLAKTDPLTSCLNRRAFFEQFETHWNTSVRYKRPISCVMVDVDHFKLVNDNHGHAMGDEVLKSVSATLRSSARNSDLVCRYGGEEFCILLPETALNEAEEFAERLRVSIESLNFDVLSVTASLGVSALELSPKSAQELLDQADKCLYGAKRNGRNQVMRWDRMPEDLLVEEEQESGDSKEDFEEEAVTGVPFHAVTALISALAYRDHATAEHSRRVADLCVQIGHEVMSKGEAYILEIGALLHDIGKIGVPDNILLKPGPLTPEEWVVMHTHDRIGVEIIEASFHSTQLSGIVENHHAFFGGSSKESGLPIGKDIPLGARILTICDSYDAMVSDRVYRAGRNREEAFAELRRCAGTQFDPELVEKFIETICSRPERSDDESSAVSRESALAIGLQIERLAKALDNNDLEGLQALAGRLAAVAGKQGVDELAEKSNRLRTSIDEEGELLDILGAAHELLDLCRATQKSYIGSAGREAREMAAV